MPIARFVLRRVALGVVTLLIVSVLVFLLTQVLGDPARAVLGRDAQIPTALEAKRAELGLDRPALEQYASWLWNLVRGDPGVSYSNGQPVGALVVDRIENSVVLVLGAAAVGIPVALVVGVYSAAKRDRAFDTGATYVTLLLSAIPEFVLAMVLVVLFSVGVFHVLPAVSEVRGETRPWDDLDGMILPIATLALVVVPYVVRSTRASLVEVLESEYVEMAELNGLPARTIAWRHALPNSLGSTLQVVALSLAYLASGIVVVEKVFNYPGVGSALVDAISAHNVPVVQFIAMFIATVYVTCNVLADVAAVLVTPRLRTTLP